MNYSAIHRVADSFTIDVSKVVEVELDSSSYIVEVTHDNGTTTIFADNPDAAKYGALCWAVAVWRARNAKTTDAC